MSPNNDILLRWPTFPSLSGTLKPYWQVQNELTIQQGLFVERSETCNAQLHDTGDVRRSYTKATRAWLSVGCEPSHRFGGLQG